MYSLNSNAISECEPAEEAVMSDTEEYLSESLRYKNVQYAALISGSHMTMLEQNMPLSTDNCNLHNSDIDINNIQIPIVGYEIMEERARFTVYKLRIEDKITGTCWYVFRRYTDFVRLCNRLSNIYPEITQYLPRKRWLKNNFDPIFLEERISGLQTLVNAVLNFPDIFALQEVQDFFCFNEPPACSETNEESKAMFEVMEETINNLKKQLLEKESLIDTLQTNLHSQMIENDNLKKLVRGVPLFLINWSHNPYLRRWLFRRLDNAAYYGGRSDTMRIKFLFRNFITPYVEIEAYLKKYNEFDAKLPQLSSGI